MQDNSIQKSDSSREEAVLESGLVRDLRLLYLFPEGRRWKRECTGCVGSLIMLAALSRQQEV